MKNIYEIQQDYLSILQKLDETEGEVTEEIDELLKINQEELQVKAINYAKYVKNIEDNSSAIKGEITRLQELKKKNDSKVERLKGIISSAMKLYDTDKISNETMSLSVTKSTAVIINDNNALGQEYIRRKTTLEPDKKLIKEALKNGEEVKGAELVINHNLQIK